MILIWSRAMLAALLLTAGLVHADRIAESRKWALDDTDPANAREGQCVASTGARLSREDYVLSLVIDKTGARPMEVVVRPTSGSSAVQIFKTRINHKDYFFGPAPNSVFAGDQAWQVPRETEKLIEYLIRNSTLSVAVVAGGRGTIGFSLAGSSHVLREMHARCGLVSLTALGPFERAFLPAEDFDGTKLTPPITHDLREIVPLAFASFKEAEAIRGELNALELKFAALANERDSQRANVTQWTDRDLPQLARNKVDAQNRIDGAKSDIAAKQRQVREANARLPAARSAADAASVAIRPHEAEHDRLAAAKSTESTRLRDAEASLESADREMENAKQTIRQLEAQAAALDGEIASLRDRLRDARASQLEADRAARSFDVNREIRARKLADSRVRSLESEIERLQDAQREAEGTIRRAQRALEEADRRWRECRGTGADCVDAEMAVRAARNDLNEIQNQRDSVRAELSAKENSLEEISAALEADVLRQQESLENAASRAQVAVLSLQNDIDAKQDLVDAINLRELPRARDVLNAAREQRPALVSTIADARSALARAATELDAFDRRVGYAELERKKSQAWSLVFDLQREVAQGQSDIETAQATIAEQTRRRESTEREIAELTLRIEAAKVELNRLNRELVEYDRDKAVITGRQITAEAEFVDLKAKYNSLLPR